MLAWLRKTTHTNCGHVGVVQKDNAHKLWSSILMLVSLRSCSCGSEKQHTLTVVIHINVGGSERQHTQIAVMLVWLKLIRQHTQTVVVHINVGVAEKDNTHKLWSC